MTLTEFLLARITEDDAHWRSFGRHWTQCLLPRGQGECTCTGPLMTRNRRGLAECEAKRRIVAMVDAASYGSFSAGWYAAKELAIRHLALPYADHPDYQQEWAS